MKIINYDCNMQYQDLPKKSIIALGMFDGFHLGHQLLFNKAKEIAKRDDLLLIAISFNSNKIVLKKFETLLMPWQTRVEAFEKYGFDYLIEINLSREILNCEIDFIDDLAEKLNVSTFIAGLDFRYGKDRKYGVQNIKERHNLEIVDLAKDNEVKISTKIIKLLIEEGNIEKANELLGHHFFYKGIVVHGKRIATTKLNAPTVNIDIEPYLILPKMGVYWSYAIFDGKKYPSLTSISTNPTVVDSTTIFFETHILNFDEFIYNKLVTIELIKYVYPTKKFDNLDELRKAIGEYKKEAINFFFKQKQILKIEK